MRRARRSDGALSSARQGAPFDPVACHLLEHVVDVEDAAVGLPQLLDDAQHEHVRAAERGEEERLEREDADPRRVEGARAEQREGEQLDTRL